jgi:hypothetical protein
MYRARVPKNPEHGVHAAVLSRPHAMFRDRSMEDNVAAFLMTHS